MAIVVEEEAKTGSSGGLIKILMWVVIGGIIVAAVYYIFFKRPDILPDISAPAIFNDTEKLSKLRLPKEIFNSPGFLQLKQYVGTTSLPITGKANPFLP